MFTLRLQRLAESVIAVLPFHRETRLGLAYLIPTIFLSKNKQMRLEKEFLRVLLLTVLKK